MTRSIERPGTRAANTILRRSAQKLGVGVPGVRTDLRITDYEKISRKGASSGIALIAFNKMLGDPTRNELSTFFKKTFGGRVLPTINKAKIISEHSAICVPISLQTERLPFNKETRRTRKMLPIVAEKRYADNLGGIWVVECSEDGIKYLARQIDEDLEAVLKERFSQLGQRVASAPLFRRMRVAAGYANIQNGDVVEFLSVNGATKGTITSISDESVSITAENGTPHRVPRENILRIVSPGAASKKKRLDAVEHNTSWMGPELGALMKDLLSGS